MRKITIFIVSLFLMMGIVVLSNKVSAEEVEIVKDGKTAILIDAYTGKVLYEKNAHEKRHPASMTKVMTMYLILEAMENGMFDWDTVISVSAHAADMGGSQVYLEAGEKMTVEDLFKCIAIQSANDATMAMAETVGGTEEVFVAKMNQKAAEWGLQNTHFVDPMGLTDDLDHYTTASDMAIMAKNLIKDYGDEVLRFTSMYEDYIRKDTDDPFWLVNTNKLVKYVEGMDGLKTGWTSIADYCLTGTMKHDDMRLIGVIMGSSSTTKRNGEMVDLLRYGFNIYQTNKILEDCKVVGTYESSNIKPHHVNIVTMDSLYHTKFRDNQKENITYDLSLNKIKPGMKIGDVVGELSVYVDGELYQKVPVTIDSDLEKPNYFEVLRDCIKAMLLGYI